MSSAAANEQSGLAIVRAPSLSTEAGIGPLTLGAFLREVTQRYGDREAAVMWLGSQCERWTYRDLWQKSLQVAQALIACGIGRGSRVGILMTNRLEFLSSVFGIALTGAIATPISTFSSAEELQHLVAKSDCSILLFERNVLKKDFVQTLIDIEPEIRTASAGKLASLKFPFLRYLVIIDCNDSDGALEGWLEFLARGAAISESLVEAMAQAVSPSDAAVLFFSSGTTGTAKGILSAHRGVCIQFWRWRRVYAVEDDLRCWTSNGFFFSGNFAMGLGMTLAAGGSLILQRWFDAKQALELMQKERATMLQAWPHQQAQLMAAPNWQTVDLSSLKYIDAISPIAAHPTVSTRWRGPEQAYGSTETFTINAIFPSGTPESVHGNSSGAVLPGNVMKIVDPLTGRLVAVGERGEIAIKGPTLMLGYIGVSLDETLDEEGFFHTGDGGYIDQHSRLYWEGRLNDIIKTGGANVSPLEVDAILREIPAVKLSQTVGIPDDLLGELIVSCIVPHDGAAISEDEIRAFAKQRLASYKVPRRVVFLSQADIETTGSAKVKTTHLRSLAQKRIRAQA